MKTPDVKLSPSERAMLIALASGTEHDFAFDWVALQRLKSFGFVEETPTGLKSTAEGRRALLRAQGS
jgi:hypothetical protein